MNRQLDALWGTLGGRGQGRASTRVAATPRAVVRDEGDRFVLTADLPGVDKADVDLHVTEDGIAIDAHRQLDVPEDVTVRRSERGAWRVRDSFTFPVKVEPDHVTADLDKGVLTVTLPKVARQQPRRIEIASA